MDPIGNLSIAERSTLNEARHLLGENLSYFLLSGLDESNISTPHR